MYEARFGQHPLLSGSQTAAGLPSRQVADYLNDLDQIPRSQLLQVRLIPLRPSASIVAAAEHGYTTADLESLGEPFPGPKLVFKMAAIGHTVMPRTGSSATGTARDLGNADVVSR